VDLSTRSGLSLLGWKKDTPLKAAVEYFNIDWELAEPPEICSLDYAMGNIDSELDSYPSGNEFVVDPR
jgi:polyamine oxidase